MDKTLSGATTPEQSRSGSDGNEEVLRIPQSSNITGTSPSDCLVSYPGLIGEVLPLGRDVVGVFYSPIQNSSRYVLFGRPTHARPCEGVHK